MLDDVRKFIKRHNLIKAGITVVVGVSGGPDSLALLHYLKEQEKEQSLTLIAAHIDHMFRGKQSEEEMMFVQQFCEERSIHCEIAQIDVGSYQRQQGLSAQEAARECRYRFFDEVMKKHAANALALAHHGDDQIETILMRLVRGSSFRGYAGIQVKRPFSTGEIIRPFLCITKKEIMNYCAKFELSPRIDPSNETDKYTRNRFRHHILPFINQENPQVHERFQQFSEQLTEDQLFLEELAIKEMNTVINKKLEQFIEIDINAFQSIPMPLQRRSIQLILNYLYKKIIPSITSIHTRNLLSFLASDHPSGVLHFPKGLRIVRSYNICTFSFHEEISSPYCYILEETGNLILNNENEISATIVNAFPKGNRGNNFFVVDPEIISMPLYVRSRRNGDKMTLKGMDGSKKVKDIYIDCKIPLKKRNFWPIVEDSNGTILWIPGLKKSNYEASSEDKGKYILLEHRSKEI